MLSSMPESLRVQKRDWNLQTETRMHTPAVQKLVQGRADDGLLLRGQYSEYTSLRSTTPGIHMGEPLRGCTNGIRGLTNLRDNICCDARCTAAGTHTLIHTLALSRVL